MSCGVGRERSVRLTVWCIVSLVALMVRVGKSGVWSGIRSGRSTSSTVTQCQTFAHSTDVRTCCPGGQTVPRSVMTVATDECCVRCCCSVGVVCALFSMADLLGRMEVPNGTKRWDEPLFTVGEDDNMPLEQITQVSPHTTTTNTHTPHPHTSTSATATPAHTHSTPLSRSWLQWVLHGKQQNPGLATLPAQLEDISYLQTLERTLNNISQSLIDRQQRQLIHAGDAVTVAGSSVKLQLVRAVKYAELKRIQGQFVKIVRLRPMQGEAAIATSFVTHLQNALNY